ncbi:MAG: hypothetical protein GWP03_00815 [Proteobacteria bacterium]|nr:hypothetical protein [Pseudomonadota bacterium]
MRYIYLWFSFFKISFSKEVEYRMDFLLQCLGYFLWFLFTIIFFKIIYSHVSSIGGWNFYQTLYLIGINQIIIYIYQGLFLRNFSNFSLLVRKGELDHLLLKPIDLQFISTLRNIDIRAFFLLPFPIILIFYSTSHLQLNLSFSSYFLLLFLIFLGLLLRYIIGFFIVIFAIWMGNVSSLSALQNEFLKYAGYPASIYKGASAIIFTYIIPIVLIANLPAGVILGKLKNPAEMVIYTILFTLIVFFLVRIFFYKAIKYYSSASS